MFNKAQQTQPMSYPGAILYAQRNDKKISWKKMHDFIIWNLKLRQPSF